MSNRFLPDLNHLIDRSFSEDEALQVLADLHGKGDKNDSLVVLEFEEIRQQVSRLSRKAGIY